MTIKTQNIHSFKDHTEAFEDTLTINSPIIPADQDLNNQDAHSIRVIGHLNHDEVHLAMHDKRKSKVKRTSPKQHSKPYVEDIDSAIQRAQDLKDRTDHKLIKAGESKPRPNCGHIRYIASCPELSHNSDHDSHTYHQTCWRIGCPTCKDKAIDRIVKRENLRIEAYQELHKAQWGKKLKEDHVSISFPKRQFTKAQIKKEGLKPIWETVNQLWQKYNQHKEGGAVAVIHLTYAAHEDGTPCHDKYCNLDHHDEWGPHVHFYGFLYFEQSKIIQRETGAVVRKHPIDYAKYGPRKASVTLKYELGHCWTTSRFINRKVTKTDVEGNAYITTERVERAEECVHLFGTLSKRKFPRRKVGMDQRHIECRCGIELAAYQPRITGYDDLNRPISDGAPDYSKRICDMISERAPIYQFFVKCFPGMAFQINTLRPLERGIIFSEGPP